MWNRVKNAKTGNHTSISGKMPIPFLYFLEKQLASQNMFVVRYSLTVAIVSQQYQELSMQVEIVNNCSIPSMHAARKIPYLSD
jgi:hypothetical protein